MPYLVTRLDRSIVFEWCVVWCGSKNGYQEDPCFKDIKLRPQYLFAILGSIVNKIGVGKGGTYTMNFMISASLMSLFLLYPKTLGNGCPQSKSHSLLSCLSPIYHMF